MSVNYIKHLENLFAKISLDDRISTTHLGLYYSLFHQWNLAKFKNPISISRSELMLTSKIGSANTYTRCLRELNDWGYIDYKPSNNPYRGSLVNLYRFDNSCDNSTDNSSDNSCDNSTDTTPVIAVRPYINNINNNKHINKLNNKNFFGVDLKKIDQPTFSKSKDEFSSSDEKVMKVAKNENPVEKPKKPKPMIELPTMEQVTAFFQEKNRSELEAQKFFNHFESNGWLVGGKAKMKNWHAAARNWILNSDKFQSGMQQKKPGDIAVNQDKKYDIPL